jgi:hypothetical protein
MCAVQFDVKHKNDDFPFRVLRKAPFLSFFRSLCCRTGSLSDLAPFAVVLWCCAACDMM